MKKIFIILALLLLSNAHLIAKDDIEKVSINIMPLECKDMSQEAAQYLASKMQQLATANDMVDNGYNKRFVFTAKVNTLSKDITSSTPIRVLQSLEIVFLIGDVIENKLFDTTSITVSGIGENETKSFISAFQKINTRDKKLSSFIEQAKLRIINYYISNCNDFITQASTLAALQEYDKAIHTLISVPNVCSECYERCQKKATTIYIQKINDEGLALFNMAQAAWAKDPTNNGAFHALEFTSQINSQASCYSQVIALHESIYKKLDENEKRNWKFQMKQYENNQKLKLKIVEACRAIGVAYGKNQSPNIVTNIISGW